MVFGDVGRPSAGRQTAASRSTAPATARSSSAPTPPTTGRRTSTSIADVDRRQRRPLVRQRVGRVGDQARGREIAEALARRLARIVPRAADDDAERCSRRSPIRRSPSAISAMIDADLEIQPGVEDVTRRASAAPIASPRCDGGRPTCCRPCVRCDRDHPLANREFLFPFASVVEVPGGRAAGRASGHRSSSPHHERTRRFRARFVASPHVDRLNFGAMPTTQIGWDQPHEGNLFEHLYARRAIQRVRLMRILSLTAGAASMYCGSCLRDNALASELIAPRPRRHAAADLHADADRRAERQPAAACSSAASASTCSSTCRSSGIRRRSSTGCGTRQAVHPPGRRRAIDPGRRRVPRRHDGVDAARVRTATSARSSTS